MGGRYVATGMVASFKTDTTELFNFELLDIKDSGEEADIVEVTSQASTDLYKEFLAGFIDGGELSFDALYDPVASAAPAAGDSGTLTITYPGATNPFSASVLCKKTYDIDAKLGERIGIALAFKVTGKPTRPT